MTPAAAVSSAGPPQTQSLTPRQRRLLQQRKKWEEAQRQQQQQPQQPRQARPLAKEGPQSAQSPGPGQASAAPDRPSPSGSGTPYAASTLQPKPKRDGKGSTSTSTSRGVATSTAAMAAAAATSPSAAASLTPQRPRRRDAAAHVGATAKTAAVAAVTAADAGPTSTAGGDAAGTVGNGQGAAADGGPAPKRRQLPHPTTGSRQQQEQWQQPRQQPQPPPQPPQQQQQGGWPPLFAPPDSGGSLTPSLHLMELSGSQLASLARQWADETAEWQQGGGGGGGATPPPAFRRPAGALSVSSSSSSSSSSTRSPRGASAEAQLPAAASARLAMLTAAVDALVTRGSAGHQDLADLVWCVGHYDRQHALRALHPGMRVPFSVVPQFMPGLRLEDFMSEVELRRDMIYLDDGSRPVEESRLTGWQSEIGATFKYSGKEMQPQPGGLSTNVLKVRDALTALTGVKYDSVLINYYADGKCGMRYHVDPLYDRWTPNTAVVSLGDTRTFIFREIRDHNTRWQYRVRNGDVVLMYDDCQDRLQHCVRVEKRAEDSGPRMSLVFKERVRGPTGQYLMP